MNLFTDIRGLVLDCLAALEAEGVLPAGLDHGAVTVEPPRDPAHGDMATNAAMVLAKPGRAEAARHRQALAERLAPTRASPRPRWPVRASSTCGWRRRSGRG
jgi:arginyl-tRNA synthetase